MATPESAHFDLPSTVEGYTSGTPFYQIAQECKLDLSSFQYLCLGIRGDAKTAPFMTLQETWVLALLKFQTSTSGI